MNASHALSMRDAIYEAPGPKMRRRIMVGTVVSLALVLAGLAFVIRQFYVTGQLAPEYWTLFARGTTWTFIARGLMGTLGSAAVAGAIALVLGLVLMLGRTSSVAALRAVSRVLIEFFRGVPSLLLIYFFFLVMPRYGVQMSSFWMITLPVGLSASGVIAEVFRAGVNAVPKGQVEAAKALGMRKAKIMRVIVLPQAVRFVIPTLIAQLVIVVKDTTFAYVVSFPDLMQNARVLITNYDALVSVYLVVAVIYIVINYLINKMALAVANRMHVKLVA